MEDSKRKLFPQPRPMTRTAQNLPEPQPQAQSLRQNRDLIDSLNDVFKNHLEIGREIESLNKNIESLDEKNKSQLIEQNNMIMEMKNSLNQRMRNYQVEQVKILKKLDNYDNLQEEFEISKNNNRFLNQRIKKLENDIINLQNYIMHNNNLQPTLSLGTPEDSASTSNSKKIPVDNITILHKKTSPKEELSKTTSEINPIEFVDLHQKFFEHKKTNNSSGMAKLLDPTSSPYV